MIKVDGFEMYIYAHTVDYCGIEDSHITRGVVGWTGVVTKRVSTPIGERITTWTLDMNRDEMDLTNKELCDRIRTFAKPKVVWRYR